MDYEKEYKSLVAKVKKAHKFAQTDSTKSVLEDILPQLRESEDERIRKKCIAIISKWTTKEDRDECLAYLEKQKEQPKEELVYRLNGLMQEYIKEGKDEAEKEHRFKCYQLFWDALEDANFFEQKEQKPIGGIYWHAIKKGEKLPCRAYIWNPDYEKYHDCWEGRLIPNLEKICVGADTWYLPAKDVRDLPREGVDKLPEEQKPAWSEEDADILNCCISSIEEAKENRYAYKETDGDTSYDHEIAWLKSLRPSWKPSEEQMEVLLNAEGLVRANNYNENAKILASLYEQLKKL